MSVWMVMAIYGGLLNLAVTLISWGGRVVYERTRAASLVAVARALAAGGILHDERPDGTVLRVEIVGPQRTEGLPLSQCHGVGRCLDKRR